MRPPSQNVGVQVTSGARTWERTQPWQLKSKGKVAATP